MIPNPFSRTSSKPWRNPPAAGAMKTSTLPSSPTVSSGYTIPVTQTSDPVQLDQILDALNTDTRANLQTFLAEYGSALTRKPTAAEDAEQNPAVRGLNAAQALKKTYFDSPSALKGGAIVNQTIETIEQHNLYKLIASTD